MDGQIAVLRQSRGPWEFQRYPLPDPEPGAILVKISYANVCGSDLHGGAAKRHPRTRARHGPRDAGSGHGAGRRRGDRFDGSAPQRGRSHHLQLLLPVRSLRGVLARHARVLSEQAPTRQRRCQVSCPYFIAGFAEYYYLMPGHVCVKVPDELSDAVVGADQLRAGAGHPGSGQRRLPSGRQPGRAGRGGLGLNMIAAARDMGAGIDHRRRRHPRPTEARPRVRRRPHHRHPRVSDAR